MKTMNKTETTCFGFYFDNTGEVFITNILICILNVMFSIITCVGNSTILLAIKNTRDLHTPSYVLLGCLAFSDLLVGLICQPLFVGVKIAEFERSLTVYCWLRMLQIRLDNSGRFVFHSSCSVRRPTNRFTPALAIQRICHRFSGFASHSGYLDLVRYIVCRAKVLDNRRMVFHSVGHFRCCIRGSNRQYHEDISDGSKTPAADKKTN